MTVRLAVGAMLLTMQLAAATLSAECPRTSGEKARRILPGVLLFPTGLLVLRHTQSRVPMPATGARVRVSVETSSGIQFTEGRFVDSRDSTFRLAVSAVDTVALPLASAKCLQVFRRSRAIGAALGMPVGVVTGMLTGFAVGTPSGDAWVMASTATIGTILGAVAGPLIGAARGAAAWDVAWEHPR